MRYSWSVSWTGCCVVLTLICGTAGICAAILDSKPVSMFMSLESCTVSLGEPVILKYCLRNESRVLLEMDLGQDRQGWLTVRVVDSTGKTVPPVTDMRPSVSGGLSLVPEVDKKGGECHMGYLVLTRQHAISQAGEYRIEVDARVPYKSENKEHSGVFTTKQVMLVRVTKKDAERLKQVSAELTDAVRSSRGNEVRTVAIQALFSMPQAEMLSAWRALAVDPKVFDYERQQITDELLRIGSSETADILAAIWTSPDIGQDRRGMTEVALLNLWWAGDDSLKKHIEGIYEAQGKTMRKPTGPIVPLD